MTENKAYLYCKKAVKENTTPKYVKLQMKDFMRICEGKNKKYKISEKKLKQLNGLLKLLNMPTSCRMHLWVSMAFLYCYFLCGIP